MAMVVGRCYMPSPQRSSQPTVRASTRRSGGRDASPPPLSCAESGRLLGAAVGLEKPACLPLKERWECSAVRTNSIQHKTGKNLGRRN